MSEELHYEPRMSDSGALMWTIEKDPLLRSTITAVSVLDGPVDTDRFHEKVERATRIIPRLRQRVVGNPYSLAPPTLGGRSQLRPQLPPLPDPRRQRRVESPGARPRAVDRDAGVRPGPPALGALPRGQSGGRTGGVQVCIGINMDRAAVVAPGTFLACLGEGFDEVVAAG